MRIFALGLLAITACKSQPPVPPLRFPSPPLVRWSDDQETYERGAGHSSTETEIFTEGRRGEVRVRDTVEWRDEKESAHVWIAPLEADEIGRLEGSLNSVKIVAGPRPPRGNEAGRESQTWTLCVRGGVGVACETRQPRDWKVDPASTALFDLLAEIEEHTRLTGQHFRER